MTDDSAPDDLAAWSLHCFCVTARRTPHAVIRLDRNGRLLHAARHGIALGALREQGLLQSESQLVLLRDFGLVAVEGEQLRTTFPVLDPLTMTAVRAALRDEAARLVAGWDAELAAIHRLLFDRNLRSHAFAIVFGYVLDGMLWTLLRWRRAVPETTLTLEQPYWRGAFWALWPPPQASAGTNELRTASARLVMTWTPASAAALDRIAADPALAADLLTCGTRVARGAAEIQSAQLQGTAPEDRWRVPAIRTAVNGPLAEAGGRIVLAIEASLASTSSAGGLDAALRAGGVADPKVATVILAHELIWEIAELLVAERKVERPAVALEAAPTNAALGDLMFVAVDG
ncbi:MAG TPA: hypothetical protein VHM00_10310 [Caldimonas sp.]|jgi:hypothetical protein|nr:hypothetical protein [Caldimonas sp.]HEX2541462.1 hypothetical protein [Caldimonas sp.]